MLLRDSEALGKYYAIGTLVPKQLKMKYAIMGDGKITGKYSVLITKLFRLKGPEVDATAAPDSDLPGETVSIKLNS
jgi:hypothetical protein